jgi:nicotinamidase-related amidase
MERITRQNSAVCLIDHQVGLLSGVRDITIDELKHNVVGLAKAARILGIRTIASTTAKGVFWGPTFPELVAVLDTKTYPIIDRMTMNAWDDPHFVKAVEATGRKNPIMAGVTIDVCLAFAAMQAVDAGYNVYGVVDASGALDVTTRELAIARMKDHGITPISWTTVAAELQRDWSVPTGQDLGRVFHDHYHSYGLLMDSFESKTAKAVRKAS